MGSSWTHYPGIKTKYSEVFFSTYASLLTVGYGLWDMRYQPTLVFVLIAVK